jgi:hypothetical protein
MGNMDSFTIAILAGAAVVILIFGAMIVLDKGKPTGSSAPASAKTGK